MLILSDSAFLAHDTGPGHPERADRLRAIIAALEAPEFSGLRFASPGDATKEQIARIHDPDYIDHVLAAIPASGLSALDGDTVLSPGSGVAALRAAGALIDSVDLVLAGEADRIFCAVRPPGHHAERAQGMGFCLFNNVAIGAAHALEAHGLERVAIVDFDVHHGNGTQEAFSDQPAVLFGSSHQSPLYPGTGSASETGVGNIINMPLAPDSGGDAFRDAWQTHFFPRLEAFHPQLIFISAGFDGHRSDPLAGLNLVESDYFWISSELVRIAEGACEGRVISTLEGGYDLDALSRSVAAHVTALMPR